MQVQCEVSVELRKLVLVFLDLPDLTRPKEY